ncbi:MAG: imidazole glycerol phosphate synthase subunit HisH, partial [Methanosarcinaceae archaeon]
MKKIVIIDYGLGNLRSVRKGLEHAGAEVVISKDPADVR